MQDFARLVFHRCVIQKAELVDDFATQKQVLSGVKIIGKGQVLIDGFDIVVTGIARIFNLGFATIDDDMACIGLICARKHLDQG